MGLTRATVPLRPPALSPTQMGGTNVPTPRTRRHLDLSRVPHAQARILRWTAMVAASNRAPRTAQAAGRRHFVRRRRGGSSHGAGGERYSVGACRALDTEADARRRSDQGRGAGLRERVAAQGCCITTSVVQEAFRSEL
jgi:hypothetical protein